MISAERVKEVADLYYDDIYNLCRLRLKNDDEASEVVQEVFLFFQKNYSELEDSFIKAWLYKVADNKIKEQFRSIAKREKELIFGAVFGAKSSEDILYEMEEDSRITDEEIEEKKQGILDSLSEKELELFELFYTKRMEYAELAKVYNTTEHAVRSRVYRLRLKIKEKTALVFMAILLLFMKL